jgi:dienelactone hydrolase
MPRPRSLPALASLVSLVAFAAFVAASAWLGRLERGGPPHADLTLEGEIPATLFLPGEPGDAFTPFVDAPPPEARPAAVVLAHGVSMDRVNVSSLARRIAGSGYAVLTLDLRGHGENRNPFPHGRARADALASDLAAAVDFLRGSALVDGSRIAVMGHSMGAGASLDFATRDAGLDAAVMISGGYGMQGPQRSPNTLFVYAAGDPERIEKRVAKLAAQLAGRAETASGETYGDFRSGTAVRRVEVPGADHATILWSDFAVREIVGWLDAAFERVPREAAPPADPRIGVVRLSVLLIVLVLPGLGLLLASLTPTTEHLPDSRRGAGLLLLAAALFVTLPLGSLGEPGTILSLEIADVVVIHFALAGLLLCVAIYLRDRAQFASLFAAPARSLLGAALGMVGVYTLLQPLGVLVHRIALTPERMGVFALATAGFLPLSLALQTLLRRGRTLSATLYVIGGRAIIAGMLIVGVATGMVPRVVLTMLPALLLVFVLVELLAASLYSASRNLLAIAALDAAWLALAVAAVVPVRL